ncbi:MAG TPA: hypothetical protein VMB81_22065 [Candidatus Sulfotelmatobacter sp.]|nr:hypothetical protein [Candidatus Sulfotelmatobacter sp.]
MPYVMLAVVGIVALMVLAKAFVAANPASLAQGLRWAAVGIAVLGVGALAATGRITLAPFVLPILYPLVRRGLPRWLGGGGAAGRPTPGQSSSIRTDFLELALDHDTGALSGQVLRGRFRNQRIEALGRAELIALWRETAAADPQSARLVETCLDRSWPDWRDEADAGDATPRARDGKMGREEALRVLGLTGEPTASEIAEAHRRLMMTNHPDHGGSDYLAAMINEAKEVLTRSR